MTASLKTQSSCSKPEDETNCFTGFKHRLFVQYHCISYGGKLEAKILILSDLEIHHNLGYLKKVGSKTFELIQD